MFEGTRANLYANKAAYLLLGSSLVVLIASTKLCDGLNYCKSELAWAVAVSTISIGLTLIHAITSMVAQGFSIKTSPFIAAFLAIMWFPGEATLRKRASDSRA
jgi:hypothetical protein